MRSEGYGTWLVCLCVRSRFLPLDATRSPKLYANRFGATLLDFKTGDFRKNTAFRTSQYAGLPREDVLDLRTLEAQDVTTKGVYRLPHAIYYCS